jgi:hypothetical protein
LGVEASCPICHLVFLTDRSYAEHLEIAHELLDDEGTRTTLRAARTLAGDALAPVATEEEVVAEPPPTVDPSHIYDPDAENPYRGLAAAVLVVLLLLGGGWTVLRSLDGGDSTVAAEEQVDASPLDLTADKATGASPAFDLDGSAGVVPVATEPAPGDAGVPAPTDTTAAPATLPPPAPSPTRAPRPTTAPTAAPTTAPPAPPPALSFVPPSVSGLRLDECPSNRGSVATWRFSYVLAGGSNWAPSASATLVAGRYSESRESRYRDISVTAIAVRNTLNGSLAFVDVPDLTPDACP